MTWCPPAWLGGSRPAKFAPDPEPTLQDFAWEQTGEILEFEPGLAWLATAVTGRHWTPLGWAQVDRIAAMLLGPARRPIVSRPSTDISPAFRNALEGETTLRRYCAALRAAAAADDRVGREGIRSWTELLQ